MTAGSSPARRVGTFAGRSLSPALFLLMGLAFLLPFATVSCESARTKFTGVQLVTWSVPTGGAVSDEKCSDDISSCTERRASVVATIALGAAAFGLLLGVLGIERGPGWCAAAGLVSTLALGSNALQIFGPTIHFHAGYWALLLGFALLSALHVTLAIRRGRRRSRASPTS